MSPRPVLGLTMGDPAGIGPEICLRALREPAVRRICTPVLFGDASVLKLVADGSLTDLPVVPAAEFYGVAQTGAPMIVDCGAIDANTVSPGKVSAACGRAAYAYIESTTEFSNQFPNLCGSSS